MLFMLQVPCSQATTAAAPTTNTLAIIDPATEAEPATPLPVKRCITTIQFQHSATEPEPRAESLAEGEVNFAFPKATLPGVPASNLHHAASFYAGDRVLWMGCRFFFSRAQSVG
jgi:hypothetical protein